MTNLEWSAGVTVAHCRLSRLASSANACICPTLCLLALLLLLLLVGGVRRVILAGKR